MASSAPVSVYSWWSMSRVRHVVDVLFHSSCLIAVRDHAPSASPCLLRCLPSARTVCFATPHLLECVLLLLRRPSRSVILERLSLDSARLNRFVTVLDDLAAKNRRKRGTQALGHGRKGRV